MLRWIAALAGTLAVVAIVTLGLGPRWVERSLNRVLVPPPYSVSPATRRLHDTLFVADLHADPLLWNRDLLARGTAGHVDIPRLVAGGVALQVFGAVTKVPRGQNYERNEATSDILSLLAPLQRWPVATWGSTKERALYEARKLHDVAARAGGRFRVVESAADLREFVDQRRADPTLTAGVLAVEGLHVLEGDEANVEVLHRAGYRIMGLTHFFDNEIGGSVHGSGKTGLTDFGRRVVQRIEDLHMLVDLAHASPRLFDDTIAVARRPVIVSHTGVKGTCDHVRNLSDGQVRRVAATGGLIGIGYWDAAVCDVSAGGIVRAITHAVGLVGADHVALGSDFDGATETPFDTTGLPLLTEGLRTAGVEDTAIAKIMGGNVLRLLQGTL